MLVAPSILSADFNKLLEEKDFKDLTLWRVWLGLKTDPKGVKRGRYIMPASALPMMILSVSMV